MLPWASKYHSSFPIADQAVLEGRKKHFIVDLIIANHAAALPWKEMINICKDAGM
ncbi:hypothetical protein BT96DRAFT_919508 [Gymnopus androsaceus JB14]|uniref:Uncharacterized protein n=1 Tax=Gymnopus androsaceus JB14 TaxID=1447944 RepID=A0A6A4HTP5_9AGAR|nr:hypothetical protein BT96DRAFT_919508 [Gymnopus androsaceus JB14]